VFLKASPEQIENRLDRREDHFFNAGLLKSQFAILEVPGYGLHLDATKRPKELVEQIISSSTMQQPL